MRGLPRDLEYRPEVPRVMVSGYKIRPLSDKEIAEWRRQLELIIQRRRGAVPQAWRIL